MLKECFLGEESSNSQYTISLQDGSGKLISAPTSESSSQIRTLDSIITELQFTPNFIKIDTDGFDFRVLRGARHTIQTHKPVLYFEWDDFHLSAQSEDSLSIFPLLRELGYEELLIFDNFGTLLCHLQSDDVENLGLLMGYTRASRQICYFDVLAVPAQGAFDTLAFIKSLDS